MKKKPTVGYEVEWAMARVIDRETSHTIKVEGLKEELAQRGDFALPQVFGSIDTENTGTIDIDSIYIFLKRNKVLVSENDVLILLRSLDQDNDGKLSYSEFVRALLPASLQLVARITSRSNTPAKIGKAPKVGTPQRSRSRSNNKKGFSPNTSQYYIPPNLKSNYKYGKQHKRSNSMQKGRKGSIGADSSFERGSMLTSPVNNCNQSAIICHDRSIDMPKQMSQSMCKEQSFDISITGRTQKEAENSSIIHAKPQFDTPPKTYKHEGNILDKSLVNDPKSTNSKREVTIRMGRWETQQEMCAKNTVLQRNGTARRSQERRQDASANPDDERELASVLKEQIDLDRESETCKNELALQMDFNLMDTFKVFDIETKGYVDKYEFDDGLRMLEVEPTEKELDLLMKRIDRDQDGIIR